MGKYIIKAIQTNFMELEVEADSFDQALRIYENEVYIEDDYDRVSGSWELEDIVDEIGDSLYG
jgi:hypothetical protein